jgi:hypothetical protein
MPQTNQTPSFEDALMNLGTKWHTYVHREGSEPERKELQEAHTLVLLAHTAALEQARRELWHFVEDMWFASCDFDNVRFNVKQKYPHIGYTSLPDPQSNQPNDQVDLCIGCRTMKHLNEVGYCGRCAGDQSKQSDDQGKGNVACETCGGSGWVVDVEDEYGDNRPCMDCITWPICVVCKRRVKDIHQHNWDNHRPGTGVVPAERER